MEIISLVVIGTSIWVYFDAKSIGIKKGQLKGFLDMEPGGWFIACLLAWLIVFPLYIVNRQKLKRVWDQNSTGIKSMNLSSVASNKIDDLEKVPKVKEKAAYSDQELKLEDTIDSSPGTQSPIKPLPCPAKAILSSTSSNSNDDEMLYVGQDSDRSSVYIVTKDFKKEDDRFQIKVRFELIKGSQSHQIHQNLLKDQGCDYENFASIEELWIFQITEGLYGKLRATYYELGGNLLFEMSYDKPSWISLKKISQTGIINQVYEKGKAHLFGTVMPENNQKVKTTRILDQNTIEIETVHFKIRVIRKVIFAKIKLNVFVEKIAPINDKVKWIAVEYFKKSGHFGNLSSWTGEIFRWSYWKSFPDEKDAEKFITKVKEFLVELENRIEESSYFPNSSDNIIESLNRSPSLSQVEEKHSTVENKNIKINTAADMASSVQIFIGIIVAIGAIWWFWGGGLENKTEDLLSDIKKQVTQDMIDQYEIAKRQGDRMQICVQAGLVCAGYLQAKDENNYRKWKDIEYNDCLRAGIQR